jgi:hypothetical protein
VASSWDRIGTVLILGGVVVGVMRLAKELMQLVGIMELRVIIRVDTTDCSISQC